MGQGIFALPGNKPTDTGSNMGNWTKSHPSPPLILTPKGYKSGQIDPVKMGGKRTGGGARFLPAEGTTNQTSVEDDWFNSSSPPKLHTNPYGAVRS